jgi:hypothetical protein
VLIFLIWRQNQIRMYKKLLEEQKENEETPDLGDISSSDDD